LITVDYDHPHGMIAGVSIRDLIESPSENARPVMAIRDPKCVECKCVLSKKTLGVRIKKGGDLFDERFIWIW